MWGSIVNALAIVAGSLLGLVFKHGIKEKYRQTILDALALSIILIGLLSALKTENILLLVISLALGSLVGEMINIEGGLTRMGLWTENRLAGKQSGLTKGFVTASLIFCVGSMAIVGSIESGISGQHDTLFVKSILDGVISIFFASTLGIGVLFSALPVLIYEGLLTLGAAQFTSFMTVPMIREISAAGGVLIMAIGINQLGIKQIRIGNMLPAILVPALYFLALPLWS